MANDNSERQAATRARRERENAIQRITARYVDDYQQRGASPLDDYLRLYPQYAREITEFALFYHALAEDLPGPDPVPMEPLSPAAEATLARIRAETPPVPHVIAGLVRRGIEVGYPAPGLAAAVGISVDVLAKLDAKAIAVSTIPFTLVERLAETLKTTAQAVAAFLAPTIPTQAGAFYYSEQPPEQRQESFLDAIQASGLDERARREWAEIVARDVPPS